MKVYKAIYQNSHYDELKRLHLATVRSSNGIFYGQENEEIDDMAFQQKPIKDVSFVDSIILKEH